MESSTLEKADVTKRLMGGAIDEVAVSLALSVLSIGTLGVAYFIGQDCFEGRSLGRRAVGQRLVSLKTGETVTPLEAVLRNAIGFAVVATQIGALVDLLLIVLHPQGRRLCDLIVGTQVVDVANESQPAIPADAASSAV